jgi:single-stranded-DNA-specific exonuclease
MNTIRGFKIEPSKADKQLHDNLKQIGHSDIFCRVASSYKIEDIDNFLNPKIKNLLPNPFILFQMDEAIALLIEVIKRNGKICIFGDYDVDGSVSCAILQRFLKEYNVDVQFYIPDRIAEGYGPNVNAMRHLADIGINLIIMVDCGTLANESIDIAKSLGVDVIVLDHHKSSDNLPNCIIVNPNRSDKPSERKDLRYLCAGGVVFLFIAAFYIESKKIPTLYKEIDLLYFLPLVALSTVCDVVPLVGLNRAFVKSGINILSKNLENYIGINSLLKKVNAVNNNQEQIISGYTFGFILGPMINAGGRIGDSELGATLLSTNDNDLIDKISVKLYSLNQERITIEKDILHGTKGNEYYSKRIVDNGFFFEYNTNWHEGVIGIIAARIKDSYSRPAIVGSLTGNIVKCSARSFGEIDIGEIILESLAAGLILKGGGHKSAGGFSFSLDKYSELYYFFTQRIKIKSDLEFSNKSISYNAALSINSIENSFLKELQALEPFGCANGRPTFLIQEANIVMYKILKEKHISLLLSDRVNNSKKFWAICFNCIGTELGDYLLSSRVANLVASIEIDSYNGIEKPKIIINDGLIQ